MSEKKRKKTSCPFASSKKAKKTKIWGDQAVQRRTSEVFGSERPRGARRNGPRKKQATLSASRTKLLDNGRGSETSTLRESRLHADVGQTWSNFVEGLLFVRGMVYCKMSGEYEVAF